MFVMMVGWHIYGKQNLSTETYRTTPEKFMAKAQAMVDKYTVRTETDQDSGGAPPPGSDVYLLARLWNFWPILELRRARPTAAPDGHGLQPRLFAAAGQHQHPDGAGLRARDDGHAQPVRHLLGRVQRVLRHWPPHDGGPHVRQERRTMMKLPPTVPARDRACNSRQAER
jgi:hypothetical protein